MPNKSKVSVPLKSALNLRFLTKLHKLNKYQHLLALLNFFIEELIICMIQDDRKRYFSH